MTPTFALVGAAAGDPGQPSFLARSFALILPLYAVGLTLDWSPSLLAWLTPLVVVVAGILHDRPFSTGHFWTR